MWPMSCGLRIFDKDTMIVADDGGDGVPPQGPGGLHQHVPQLQRQPRAARGPEVVRGGGAGGARAAGAQGDPQLQVGRGGVGVGRHGRPVLRRGRQQQRWLDWLETTSFKLTAPLF